MTKDDWLNLFKYVTPLIGTVSAIIAAIRSQRAVNAVQEVHLSINSRMDQLLKATEASVRAEEQVKAATDAATVLAAQTAISQGKVTGITMEGKKNDTIVNDSGRSVTDTTWG